MANVLIVEGGHRLEGEIKVQGAKNSVLPLLAGTVLCHGQTVLHNCPNLTDADAACRILECLGCKCVREGSTLTIDSSSLINTDVPQDLMTEMRSSIVFLGAILGRAGQCKLSKPGGCELGARPIDLHLSALGQMGVSIETKNGFLVCNAPKGITGAHISLHLPSVGATENIMLAAVTAKGVTEIENAAREPEISDLADFLSKCGAKIKGAGTGTIIIEGVEKLNGTEHTVIPDRIVTASYLCMGAITRGELTLKNSNYRDIGAVIPILEEMGARIYTYRDDSIYINARKNLVAPNTVRTSVHPGFPTDAQPLLMALTTTVKGTSMFVENIFDNRFRHATELTRLGAKITVEGKVAVVEGVEKLSAANVEATDLRGGAALVTAALTAEGITRVSEISHIDRGYDSLEQNLSKVGAKIRRE